MPHTTDKNYKEKPGHKMSKKRREQVMALTRKNAPAKNK